MAILTAKWKKEDGKDEFIKKVWGETQPNYLFYALGRITSVENKEIIEQLFGKTKPGFGDIELHKSSRKEIGNFLRIRNPEKIMLTLSVVPTGKNEPVKVPLYQVGHGDDQRCIDFVDWKQLTKEQADSNQVNYIMSQIS